MESSRRFSGAGSAWLYADEVLDKYVEDEREIIEAARPLAEPASEDSLDTTERVAAVDEQCALVQESRDSPAG
jgi:hypothetical protein